MLVYLREEYHMEEVFAVNVVNIWSGTCNFAPLLGAFVSDAYLGRFRTLALGSFASFLGVSVLTVTATLPQLRPPPCDGGTGCVGPSSWQLWVLFTGLGIMSIGAGAIRPCNLPFGMEQFDPSTEKGRAAMDSFFSWYYLTFSVAVMVALTVVVYIQDSVSWALGLGIPTILIAVSIVIFFMGADFYVYVEPQGSVFTSFFKVASAAYRKRHLTLPTNFEYALYDPHTTAPLTSKLPLTNQFKFLNKAAIIESPDELNPNESPANEWRLCSLQQVEELKCLFRVVPIWASAVLCFATMDQHTFSVLQALSMDRRLGSSFKIPAGSMALFTMLSLTVWIPIYDRIFLPLARKLTKKEVAITLLQKMRVGLSISVVYMLVAALTEKRRREMAIESGNVKGISPMSVLCLVPQFVLAGVADAFNSISQMEFYYKQLPYNMRTIAGSLFFCSMATASYLSSFIVNIVHKNTGKDGRPSWIAGNLNEARRDYFYSLMASLAVINLVYYVRFACRRVDKNVGVVTPNIQPSSKTINDTSYLK